jgi:hypothetical protein
MNHHRFKYRPIQRICRRPYAQRGKNIDCLIKMRGSSDVMSDEEPMASMKTKKQKKIIQNPNLQQRSTFHPTNPL